MTIYSHMRCPFCESDTKIYNSRGNSAGNETWRRHRCRSCSLTFTTRERIDWSGKTLIADVGGTVNPYSSERLLKSLLKAGDQGNHPDGTFTSLLDTIENNLQKQHFFSKPTGSSAVITEVTITVLSRFDRGLALQYVNNVYRSQPPAKLIQQLFS